MNPIYVCSVLSCSSRERFETTLNKEIELLQSQGLDVDVQFDAEHGFNALLVARRQA